MSGLIAMRRDHGSYSASAYRKATANHPSAMLDIGTRKLRAIISDLQRFSREPGLSGLRLAAYHVAGVRI